MKYLALIIFSMQTAQAQSANVYRAQLDRSVRGALANMLENGATVASPSKSNPDYFYDWVRDTSLTMKMVAQLSQDPELSSELKKNLKLKILHWIDFESARQQTQTLTGLGEPKFYVSGKANLEPWGRPQNDGPALRALTAIEIANQWLKEARFEEVQSKLYRAEMPANTMIKRDLEYVAHHWNEASFDLWEEERGMHFYTLTVQKVALLKGASLAKKMNDLDAAAFYSQQSKAIENYLNAFVDPSRGIIRYALNKNSGLLHKKSDLDIAVVLAAIQTFDGNFYVPVKPMIKTANQLIQAFDRIYPLNQTKTTSTGVPLGTAMGRYPEDRYSGVDLSEGNPWFLSTLALAEFICDLNKTAKIPAIALHQFNRVLTHRNADGSLSEQFNRKTGYTQGARDLTWSYTSYITAYRACFAH